VGSGVIEAGCKTLIGSRLKRSGMFWTVRGANAASPSVAAVTVVNSTIIGSLAGNDCPFWVAHPLLPEKSSVRKFLPKHLGFPLNLQPRESEIVAAVSQSQKFIRGEPVESCKLRYFNSFEIFDHTG
jgi:hypothetical protein